MLSKQLCLLLQTAEYYSGINDLKLEKSFYNGGLESHNASTMDSSELTNCLGEPSPVMPEPTKEEIMKIAEDEDKYEHYFRDHPLKKVRLGQTYQVDEVPLQTDMQDYEYLQRLEAFTLGQC